MHWNHFARRIQNPAFLFGRFAIARQLHRAVTNIVGRPLSPIEQSPTLFPNVDPDFACEEVRREAVFVGLRLPAYSVEEIKRFALAAPLHPINDRYGLTFKHEDIVRGRCRDGRRMPIGGVPDPEQCPAVRELIEDPILRTIIRNYLGYEPTKRLTLLSWSFASDLTEEECREANYGVIDYHYDLFGFNFVYANFYITDADRNSGAHVMMRRSHGRKPLSMLRSLRASEQAVWRHFGRDNELMIEGPAGTGFVQDTFCFHRATRAKTSDRLMLAIRFS